MLWKIVSMTNGSNLSLELLIHYLLTPFPTAVAALSKFACLHHILQAVLPASDGRPKTLRHRWLFSWAQQGHEEGVSEQWLCQHCRRAGPVPSSQPGRTLSHCFSPAKTQLSYKLLEIVFPAAVVGCWPTICFQNHPCKADFNSGGCTPKGLEWFGSCGFAKTHNAWNMLPPCCI